MSKLLNTRAIPLRKTAPIAPEQRELRMDNKVIGLLVDDH